MWSVLVYTDLRFNSVEAQFNELTYEQAMGIEREYSDTPIHVVIFQPDV